MRESFELYLAEYDEYMFKFAYQCGYKAAKEQKHELTSNIPWYLLEAAKKKAGATT
ncbi:MAG: hypothetical protein LUI07_07925 [Lachnospiraceae bacterium]|nr:hypothetical protein [Lachnospiraceae bacterium]